MRDEKIVRYNKSQKKLVYNNKHKYFRPASNCYANDVCSIKREIRRRQTRRNIIIMKMERRKQLLTSCNEKARIRNEIIKME